MEDDIPDENIEERARRYPLRERTRKGFPDMVQYMPRHEDSDREPLTMKEALHGKDKERCSNAIEEELARMRRSKLGNQLNYQKKQESNRQ